MKPLGTSRAGLSRRSFIKAIAAAMAVPALPGQSETSPAALIDTNVSLGQWPFRHMALADTPALVAKLRAQGVTQAWAGSFEALLHKDLASVNARLAEACAQLGGGMLTPIGALNPMLPGWEEDLRRCAEVHRMPGVRLHPNYHGYALGDSIFERVLQLASEWKLLVQISVIMEEERTIHRLVRVPPTETAPLATALEKSPQTRVQLLNAFRTLRGTPVLALAARGVSFEIAMLEGIGGVAKLLEKLPPERLCFGSHAPFFYFESAKLKLQESALSTARMKALCAGNALRLLARS